MGSTKFKAILLLCFMLQAAFSSAQITIGLLDNSEDSFDGYTLIAPMRSNNIYLIDNCGDVVHSWQSQSNNATVAYLLPDGSLVRSVASQGSFGGGGITGGIEIINWEGEPLLTYNYTGDDHHHHHDLEVLPNGNILVLAWERKTSFEVTQAGRVGNIPSSGVWPEHIVELKPTGESTVELVWEWHLWDHMIQDVDPDLDNYGEISMNPHRVNINYGSNQSDWIHANAIDYNPIRDEIIISSRNFDEFWIIDHSTTTEEAASSSGGNSGKGGDLLYRWGNPSTYGLGSLAQQSLFGQHDVHWISSGLPFEDHIMIFNNVATPNGSSVLIMKPPMDQDGQYIMNPGEVAEPKSSVLELDGGTENGFLADRVSGAQMLANGSVLICEGTSGRLLELNFDNELLWSYINPQGSTIFEQGQEALGNTLFRAYRYSRYFEAFDGKTLTPQGPIELNPVDNGCMLYTSTLETDQTGLLISYDGFNLFVEQDITETLSYQLFDIQGKLVKSMENSDPVTRIGIEELYEGMYILQVFSRNNRLTTYKFVKL